MDHIICFAAAYHKEVLNGFGSNGAQAADEDDGLGFELCEQNREEVAEGVVEEDVQD